MKSMLKFLAILFLILLFSAWAAPLLFRVLPFEYERILNRLVMVLTLAAVYLIYIRGRERATLLFGLLGPAKGRWFASGFLFGVFTLIWIVLLELLLGARRIDIDLGGRSIFYLVGKALLNGVAVGVFEEWFFRGFLLRSFHRAFPLGTSVLLMNVCYALAHFIENGNLQGGAQASFINSLRLMVGIFGRFLDPGPILMGSLGLFIFGYLLTVATLRTGSLYLSMGIHGGLVTALKLHGKIIKPVHGNFLWFFGDNQYYNGVFGWLCLIVSIWLLGLMIKKFPWPKTSVTSALRHPSSLKSRA